MGLNRRTIQRFSGEGIRLLITEVQQVATVLPSLFKRLWKNRKSRGKRLHSVLSYRL